ncbi:MAG: hypothetical protein NC392_10380 [Roseburia sp.]|nr:hypothetical protein [Roseburia sp.]
MQGTIGKKRLRTKRNVERNHFRKVHRQIKDRLFRFLFEKDKEALLQLYNALNGTFSDLSCR